MKRKIFICLFLFCLPAFTFQLAARGTYQEPEEFLAEVFAGTVPKIEKLWLRGEIKDQVRSILGHDLGVLRVSYWQDQDRTAWILDEIGKTMPITVGIVIHDDKIETVKILVFRESRGWEVRYPFFTDQFIDAGLDNENELDRGIDGISGATLSVRAVNRLAVLALYFHQLAVQ